MISNYSIIITTLLLDTIFSLLIINYLFFQSEKVKRRENIFVELNQILYKKFSYFIITKFIIKNIKHTFRNLQVFSKIRLLSTI
jgi:hypothetical protein